MVAGNTNHISSNITYRSALYQLDEITTIAETCQGAGRHEKIDTENGMVWWYEIFWKTKKNT
jgi:hypothetical protein